MDSVLIISSNESNISQFSQLLKTEGCGSIDIELSAAAARKKLSEAEYDVIIINSPLLDEYGDLLAADAAEMTAAGIVLLVKGDCEKEVEERVRKYGVFVLAKPLSKTLFYKSLHLLEAARNRLEVIRSENVRLQRKIDDTKIINRAKSILMEYLSMTESQAHKYLERQAMDLRVTKVEVAKRLLSTYEN